jgi:site-specific recombinase XerD
MKDALPAAWLFPNPRTGGSYSVQAIRKIWDKAKAQAGIGKELRLYDATRHSFASQLREAGVKVEDLRDHLGHTTIQTTLKYAHGSLAAMRANLEKLSLRKVEPLIAIKEKK